MPVSVAQKRASLKYDKTHMATVACKIKKEQAAAFKDFAARLGKTSNALIKEYVLGCIAKET